MKKILKGLLLAAVAFLPLLVLMAVGIFSAIEPEIMGIITGMLLAVELAFAFTMLFLVLTNCVGDTEGSLEDFIKEPIKFQ